MAYCIESTITRMLLIAHSCPFLYGNAKCAGGDYCNFAPGKARVCCFHCNLFHKCPDKSGVCSRFLGKV